MKGRVLMMSIVAGLGGMAETLWAQAALEEIIVTATRREQNLQDVPVSIVAITGTDLELRGLDTLERVGQAVPNVVITGAGSGTSGTVFRVRGIPNVGTYVDGIWQVSTAGFLTQELVDVDRIEVLRGPQGTVFGRDSTGGAIRIWTRRPAEEYGADVELTLGSYDRRDLRLAVDVPLTDRWLTKWTAASFYRDGYIENLTLDQHNGGVDQAVLRGDVLWMPTDTLDVRLNLQSNRAELTEPRVQDAVFRTFADPGVQQVIGIPEFYGTVPGLEPYTAENQMAGYPGGKVGGWQTRSNISLPSEIDTDQASIDVHWRPTDAVSLQFLTGYTDQPVALYTDWDNSQYDIVSQIDQRDTELFSQEIQVTGHHGRFEWLSGLYYWDQEQRIRSGQYLAQEFQTRVYDIAYVLASDLCTAPVPAGFQSCSTVIYGPAGRPPSGALTALAAGSFDRVIANGQDGYALFGEAKIALPAALALTVGLRYHDEDVRSQSLAPIPGVTAPKPTRTNEWYSGGDPYAGTPIGVPTAFSYDKLTSRLSLEKRFSDAFMGYVLYSEGFNSGGIATPTVDGVRLEIPYEPETMKNFELGLRSDWAAGRVRLNATLFRVIWADLQARTLLVIDGRTAPALHVQNVGEAEAKGLELELSWLPTDRFGIDLALGLLETGFTELPAGQMSGHLPWTTDTEFAQAPEQSYTLGAQYDAPLRGGGLLTARLDYLYQSEFWRSEPFLRMDAYASVPPGYDESGDSGILNARLVYEPPARRWQVAVFGTNLTNEYTLNSGLFSGAWGLDFATVGRPREAGVSLSLQF